MIKSTLWIILIVVVLATAAEAVSLSYVCDLGPGRVREIHADDNYVYIGTDGSGIGIYDKSDWSQVWYEADWPGVDGYWTYSMGQDLVGTDYYVARWEPGVFHYDVTDPTNPVLVDRWCDPPFYDEIKGVVYHNDYVYARSKYGLFALEADNLVGGAVDWVNWQVETENRGIGITVYARGDYLFAPSYYQVRVYDISTPDELVYVTSFARGYTGEFYGDYYIGTYTYKGDILFGVYDISDINNITLAYEWHVGDDELVCQGKGVDIQGNYMYVTDRYTGIYVFDISDILNPVLVEHVETIELAEGLLADGDYLYVGAAYEGGMVYAINQVPEPATVFCAFSGLAMFAGIARRRLAHRRVGGK